MINIYRLCLFLDQLFDLTRTGVLVIVGSLTKFFEYFTGSQLNVYCLWFVKFD